MIAWNCVIPVLLCFARVRQNHVVLGLIAIGSIVGMWLERFNIVTMTLRRTHLPSAWGTYAPTFWDWAIFIGTLGLFLSAFLLALRLVPIISMFEMRELLHKKGAVMIVALFDKQDDLLHALHRLRTENIGPLETYTPAPLDGESEQSPIPLIVLLVGLLGAAASFLLQTWSSMVAYPFKVGGRPGFSWPPFIVTTFENAVLIAIVAGFVAYMVINRMPRLYAPIDEADALREASGDGWVLAVQTEESAPLDRARALLKALHAVRIEDVPG